MKFHLFSSHDREEQHQLPVKTKCFPSCRDSECQGVFLCLISSEKKQHLFSTLQTFSNILSLLFLPSEISFLISFALNTTHVVEGMGTGSNAFKEAE